MSIQSKLNNVVNTIGASAISGTIAKNKADENKLKGNLETNIANRQITNQSETANAYSKNQLAKIKMRQALANEFRDSMASLIGSKITNKNMPIKEKLELQDKLYSMEDNEILANIDLFKNSEDRIQTLKDYRKEV